MCAMPWGSLVKSASEEGSKFAESNRDTEKEKAKLIMKGLVEGNVTKNPQAGESTINWDGTTFGLGGLGRQQKLAGIEEAKARTGYLGEQTKEATAQTKAKQMETEAMPINLKLKQATDNLAADKANWQRDYESHKQNIDFEQKQAANAPFYRKALVGGKVIGASAQKLQKEKQDLATRKGELDKRELDIRNQMNQAIAGFGSNVNKNTQYTIGQVIDTPKGKARIIGLTDPNDPDIELVQ